MLLFELVGTCWNMLEHVINTFSLERKGERKIEKIIFPDRNGDLRHSYDDFECPFFCRIFVHNVLGGESHIQFRYLRSFTLLSLSPSSFFHLCEFELEHFFNIHWASYVYKTRPACNDFFFVLSYLFVMFL